jgi:DtxR family transcriptional regulator, Mn-dependent transcriptional regulator
MTDVRPTYPALSSCCAIRATPAVEDALRTIFVLSGRGEEVSTSALAEELHVTSPTVSGMLKRLAAHGLVERNDHAAALTPHGAVHARDVVRRHRLVETFLVEVLGMRWDEVHAEADVLEHAVSERLVERIDVLLGRPVRDPHGDPIPRTGGGHDEEWGVRLDSAPVGAPFDVERIYDRDGAALRYLAELGIRPGTRLDVMERAPLGGPLWVRLDGAELALGDRLARLVHGRVPVAGT